MNATVMTTGPGVIMATATASRNWRSFNQWKRSTTPPYKNGTMARPLPKTNAPASAKNQPIFQSVPAVASPWTPLSIQLQSDHGATANIPAEPLGMDLTALATTPLSTNSQMASDSLQAVTSALSMKMPHSRRSPASVSFSSFCTLRAMMEMTAAPIP